MSSRASSQDREAVVAEQNRRISNQTTDSNDQRIEPRMISVTFADGDDADADAVLHAEEEKVEEDRIGGQ